jgi:subtilase family serine protease|tara:strand:- start:682 stop:810 length:129 start_codon:yes stop_codon:yes gene_type:complete
MAVVPSDKEQNGDKKNQIVGIIVLLVIIAIVFAVVIRIRRRK